MRMFGATVVYISSFFFNHMGQTRFNFFYLGINSRGIFQVNFDLWPFYCSVPVAVKSNQIFWIFFTNFLFLQHCPVMGKHILTILMNCKNKMNIIPSTTRIDWCAFVLHVMFKKNKMLFIKFHIVMKKVFLLVQKNLNQSNHIFVVERKHFVIFVNDQSDLVLQVLGILFDQSDLVLCLYLLLSLVILHTIVIVSSNITGSVRW